MSYRTAPLVYRPGAAGSTRVRSEMPCRWCGRRAGLGQGDIVHYNVSPGGRSWAEHESCRPKPKRDWLNPGRIP
jgi:hypothetical protein